MDKAFQYFLLFLLLASGCRNEAPAPPKNETTRVRVMDISSGTVNESIHSSGLLASEEEIKLSFKTGGIIAKINVKEGDEVKKGEALAALNLSEISANAEMAGNGYEKALRDWTRAKNLYADSVATLEQYQNATTALNVAKSNLEIARFNLIHSSIKAPDDGTVLKILARENELAGPGYPVFLFGSKGKFWKVKAGISDRDIVKINPGDSAAVTIGAWPGVRFSAIVDQVSTLANPMTGTFETGLSLDDKGYRLASGFIAGVDIFPSGSERYVLLPVGAVIDADDRSGFIFSVTDSSTAVKYPVSVGAIRGSEVAVTGIPEGVRRVITEGAAYVKDRMKVEVVK